MMPSRQLVNIDRKVLRTVLRLLCLLYDLKIIDNKIAAEFHVGPTSILRWRTSSTGGR